MSQFFPQAGGRGRPSSRDLGALAVGFGCLTALLIGFFGPVLFRGEQFSFRDAAHFYYPLYLRVQQEWQAGRLPLWSPEENSGMPLLGNPTAAVLYPGKLIYAALPYAWGARIYTIGHSVLALLAMYALMRSWEVGRAGSGLSAIAYSFGAPILFQYCNIIFLVGAAWIPLGIRAADRWLRLGRRWALAELAVVLAMQTLGGEPQSAYLVGLCGGAYAVALSLARSGRRWPRVKTVAWIATMVGGAWIALTILAGAIFPAFRKPVMPPELLPWTHWVPNVVLIAWAVVAYRLWKARSKGTLWRMLVGLAASAGLAAALAGMQLLPVLEFSSMTIRASLEGTHDILPFSFEPVRVVELLWPSVFGNPYLDNRNWVVNIIPYSHPKYWIPSFYLGSMTLLLALAACVSKSAPSWVSWMKGIALVSLIGSFGEYASPLYYARQIPILTNVLGRPDKVEQEPLRFDGKLRNGEGSPYSLASEVLPGFRSFRYPSKLLTFTSLAIAALAGFGWDRAVRVQSRAAIRIGLALLAASALATIGIVLLKASFLGWLARSVAAKTTNGFGPFNPTGAWIDARNAVLQSTVFLAASVGLIALARRRPVLAGALALGLSTADLIAANSQYVISGPQADFEGTPRILALIQEAERKDPAPGPFRVHRMSLWAPPAWHEKHSDDRVREFSIWERDTIQPKYAIPFGLEYTVTEGTAELYDYMFFFSPFNAKAPPELSKAFRIKPGDPLVYYPRRGFDLWGSRYFVLPGFPANDPFRGIATFRPDTDQIYPVPGSLSGPSNKEAFRRWAVDEDVQILRNRQAYPRAWVVHKLRLYSPVRGLRREDRKAVMEEMLFANDVLWNSPDRILFDPHQEAWVEDEGSSLNAFRPGGAPDPAERVRVLEQSPVLVELDVDLSRPGVVVLADVYYPGWELTVDDKPAEILRVNRLMRGAALPSGPHHLVYRYRPKSVWIGAGLSAIGLLGLVAIGFWSSSGRNSGWPSP